jgi:hypothetical protein
MSGPSSQRYVFLDIDGVLNAGDGEEEKRPSTEVVPLDEALLAVFVACMHELEAAPRIVLTSSHRTNAASVAYVKERLACVSDTLAIYDVTPDFEGEGSRTGEIFEYLRAVACKGDVKQQSAVSYVVIDDMDLTARQLSWGAEVAVGRLVRTDESIGFSNTDAQRTLALLRDESLVITNPRVWANTMQRSQRAFRLDDHEEMLFSRADFLK